MADLEQVHRFFGHLYQVGQTFELVVVKDGKARRKVYEFDGSGESGIYEHVEAFEAAEWNVYASVLPLELQSEGLYDRVWMDRDDPFGPWPFGADPNWSSPAWPEPTTLVRTSEEAPNGQRWQAIWKIAEPVSEDEGRSLIKRIARAGKGDESVHDPRRVLRVPGVRNAKRGVHARLLETSNGLTNPEQFMLPDDITSGPVTVEALMNVQVTAPHEVLGEWLEGSAEGDRARKAFVTARFLKSCKVSFEDTLAIVNTGAKRATPPLSDEEVVHAVRSAYNRAD